MSQIKFSEDWVEVLTAVFLLLGFIIAVLLQSSLFSYLTVLLAGLVAGRIFYIKRYTEPILPFTIMVLGFLVGYLIGGIWTSRFLILLFFGLGFGISYYIHMKQILVIFKSKGFIK